MAPKLPRPCAGGAAATGTAAAAAAAARDTAGAVRTESERLPKAAAALHAMPQGAAAEAVAATKAPCWRSACARRSAEPAAEAAGAPAPWAATTAPVSSRGPPSETTGEVTARAPREDTGLGQRRSNSTGGTVVGAPRTGLPEAKRRAGAAAVSRGLPACRGTDSDLGGASHDPVPAACTKLPKWGSI